MDTGTARKGDLEQVRLASSIQGVELDVRFNDRWVRVLIAGCVFETRFCAGNPEVWVQTYYRHQVLIDQTILRKALDAPEAAVIMLLDRDFPHGAP